MSDASKKNPLKIGILTSGLNAIFVKQAWKGFEAAIKGTAYELELFETQPSTKVEENVYIKALRWTVMLPVLYL